MRLCDWDEMTKAFVPAPYLERRSIVAYFWVKLFNQPLSLWPFEVTHSENSSFFPSTNSFYSFHEQFNFTCSINSNCSQQDTSNFGSTRLNKRVNCVNKTIGMITLEIDQLILFATGYEKYEQFRYASRLHSNGKLLNKLFSVGKSYWKNSVVYGPYLIPWKGYLIVESVVYHPIEEGWWATKGLNGQ